MEFNCSMCHKNKEGRKFVYASSSRTVKVFVCQDCHRTNIEKMQTASNKILGGDVELGVLKPRTEE